MPKKSCRKDWRKIIILMPTGDPKTRFSIGFYKDDIYKLSTATRKVRNGPFGMRMGPENCGFFIVSNKKDRRLGLKFVEYADIDDKTYSKLPLY
ncbi:hypothetical protein KJ786_02985 [Patescibacteria group bacterium]|nr:hypothetical protein [Patescibacteria group bacterium]